MTSNQSDSAPTSVRVAAVVVTHNRKALLHDCLGDLFVQTRPPDEIFVIDNAGTDGTEEMIYNEFPKVTYIRMQENLGASGGFSKGIMAAYEKAHDWIWLMDDDTGLEEHALETLLRPELISDPSVSVLASAVLRKDGSVNPYHRYLFDLSPPALRPVQVRCYEDSEFIPTDVVSFSGMLIRREAIAHVGLPRTEFFIYSDDAEYSLRIRSQGGKLLTVPGSRIVDRHPGALAVPRSVWRAYYLRRNTLYTYRKYGKANLRFYVRLLRNLVLTQIKILHSDAYKYTNTKILWLSTFHGLTGRLGKTIAPGGPITERDCKYVLINF
jgi:rhamnopyranosyl-N-acetylglucosaminyl-diphospho-decaprenol beta-1,3/1,4-galactofuranosyltransferase